MTRPADIEADGFVTLYPAFPNDVPSAPGRVQVPPRFPRAAAPLFGTVFGPARLGMTNATLVGDPHSADHSDPVVTSSSGIEADFTRSVTR